MFVTQGVLQALGVQPRLGRWFAEADEVAAQDGLEPLIITDGFWQRRFGGDPSVIGRRVAVDGRPSEIIGVMPSSFRFLNLQPQPDVILPQQLDRARLVLGPPAPVTAGPTPGWQGLARLKPGVTLEDANADVRRMLSIWLDAWPLQAGGFSRDVIEGWRLAPALHPLKVDVVGNVGDLLWVLMATIGLVLLIACANVANLMLVRADGRRREFTVRAALGAGRWRIAREVLVESLALGIAGGAAGLLLAYGALRLITAIGPSDLPRLDEIALDPRALAFTFMASMLSAVAFGVVPAWRAAAHGDAPLTDNSRSAGTSRERHRARNTFVVVQVALAAVLLVCSGLMVRTVQALRNVKPGFTQLEQVQTMRIWVPPAMIADPEQVTRAQHEVLDRIRAVPGVSEAGFASMIPLEGRFGDAFVFVEGQTYAVGSTQTNARGGTAAGMPPSRRMKSISPGYFAALGTRIVAGRDVTWNDIYNRRPVALISENFAREVWTSPQAAVGRHIHEATPPERAPVWREIIGVVEDVHEDGLYKAAPTFAYWPVMMSDFFEQATFITRPTAFVIRSPQAGSEALIAQVRQAVWSLNPDMPVFLPRTMQDLADESLAATSFALVMLAIAGAMALGLGIIGIYGVISYVVSQRTREIGLRLALGAEPSALRRLFVLHGLTLTGIGAAAGLAAAVGLTRMMASLLFGISPLDPATYALVFVVVLVAAMLASYLPARRAALANPMTALAAE